MAVYDLAGLGAAPTLNRRAYRQAAAMARPGQRRARAGLRGCSTGRCGLSNEVVVGGARFPIPEALNRPFSREGDGLRRYRPLVSMVGQTLSVPALAEVSEKDADSTVMLRATNLSSIVAAILIKLEPEQRKSAIALLAGKAEYVTEWSASVMGLAKKLPGGLGIVDAIRFSLAMHYLVGIAHDAAGRESMYATAYRQGVKVYRDAEERVKTQVQGLGTVSLAATAPAPPPKACEWWDVGCHAQNAGKAIQQGADAVAKGVQQAGAAVQEGLNNAANWTTDILCKGIKAIIPEPVGGFLCAVFTKGIELFVSFINSTVELLIQMVNGLVEFVKAVVKGDFMGAAKAVLNSITRTIFILPPIGPLFSTFLGIPLNEVDRKNKIKRGEKPGPKSLLQLGDDVSKRSPFFILILVMAIIAVVTGPGRNSIGALIVALAPAVAVLVAALLKNGGQFKEMLEVALATAIEKIVKITVVVVQGIMTLAEMFKTFSEKLQRFFEKKGGAAGGAQAMAGNVMKKLSERWSTFWNAITGPFQGASKPESNPNAPKKTLTTDAITRAMMDLLAVGPDLLYALAGDDEDLKAALDDGKAMFDVTGEVTKAAKAIWTESPDSATASARAGGGPVSTMPALAVGSAEHLRLMAAVVAAGPLTESVVARRYVAALTAQRAALQTAAAAFATGAGASRAFSREGRAY